MIFVLYSISLIILCCIPIIIIQYQSNIIIKNSLKNISNLQSVNVVFTAEQKLKTSNISGVIVILGSFILTILFYLLGRQLI